METTLPITDIHQWQDNPRNISINDFERLKEQIIRLGLYERLVVNEDGIVLSGNTRLKALKELGYTEINVTVVEAKTKSEMLEYALSANDHIGVYDDSKLKELLSVIPTFELNLYKVDLNIGQLLESVINSNNEEDINNEKNIEIKREYEVVITAIDEKEQQQIYESLKTVGYNCRLLVL
jgi:ParB-like chromosome segregation protein Spo0J